MSLPQLKQPGYTLEDWKTWDGRWELINGVAYDMTPAPTTVHQELVGSLYFQIRRSFEVAKRGPGGGDCRVFVSPIDVFLSPGQVVQPDLVVVCDPAKIVLHGIEGPPNLVIEVLSPSTAGKDWSHKRWAYEAARVREYLIVDPEEQVAELLCLDAEGHYQTAARVDWGAVVALLGGKLSLTMG